MIDRIEFPDQASDEDGRHSRRARAAPAHEARLRAMARTAPARGARCEPNRTRAGTHPPAQNNPRLHGASNRRQRRPDEPQSVRTKRGDTAGASRDRADIDGPPRAAHPFRCRGTRDARARARPASESQQGPASRRRRTSAPRCQSTRQTRIERGTRGRSPADEDRSRRNDPRPTVGTRPRLVHARPVAQPATRACSTSRRFADPCRSAFPTSRHDHRRGNRHEPSSSTDRRPAEVAGTRAGPQSCPG